MAEADPLARFAALFEEARRTEAADPTAVSLATAGRDARPSVRMVLLKGVDPRGFVFFTNDESRKGRELAENPAAALCVHWPALGVQVRVEGTVERVSEAEADEYFATRARESQLGAWASAQSRPLASREDLLATYRRAEERFRAGPVPRPPHWGGYRVVPSRIEFWRAGDHRLHHREVFERHGGAWQGPQLLAP